MKKAIALITLAIFVTTATAEEGDSGYHVGGGLTYGTDTDLGIQANVYKKGAEDLLSFIGNFAERAEIGGDLTIFFPSSGLGADISFITVNVNVLPFFQPQGDIALYGIGGLNLARTSVEVLGRSASDTDIGINIGGGGAKPMDFGTLYGEAKLVLGGASQLVLGVGVRRAF